MQKAAGARGQDVHAGGNCPRRGFTSTTLAGERVGPDSGDVAPPAAAASRGAILAAAALLALALTGYLTGQVNHSSSRGAVFQLVGAAAAPNASAPLRIGV